MPKVYSPRMQEELIQEQIAEITALLKAGRKIEAIKLVREYTGLGLAEAKNLVERIENSQGLETGAREKAKPSGCGAMVAAAILFGCLVLGAFVSLMIF